MYILTSPEFHVLKLIVSGKTSADIAVKLKVSKRTIDETRKLLYQKFSVKTVQGLLVKAMTLGLFYRTPKSILPLSEILTQAQRLTIAETWALHSMLNDCNRQEVADQLDCSLEKVNAYNRSIRRKWKVSSIQDLIIKAVKKGYIELAPSVPHGLIFSESTKRDIWRALKETKKRPLAFEEKFEIDFSIPRTIQLKPKELKHLRFRILGMHESKIAEKMECSGRELTKDWIELLNYIHAKSLRDVIRTARRLGIICVIHTSLDPHKLSEEDVQTAQVLKALCIMSANYTISRNTRNKSAWMARVQELQSQWGMYTLEGLLVEGVQRGLIRLQDI